MTSTGYGRSELLKTWDYVYVVKSWLRAGDSYLNLFELQFPHLLKKIADNKPLPQKPCFGDRSRVILYIVEPSARHRDRDQQIEAGVVMKTFQMLALYFPAVES